MIGWMNNESRLKSNSWVGLLERLSGVGYFQCGFDCDLIMAKERERERKRKKKAKKRSHLWKWQRKGQLQSLFTNGSSILFFLLHHSHDCFSIYAWKKTKGRRKRRKRVRKGLHSVKWWQWAKFIIPYTGKVQTPEICEECAELLITIQSIYNETAALWNVHVGFWFHMIQSLQWQFLMIHVIAFSLRFSFKSIRRNLRVYRSQKVGSINKKKKPTYQEIAGWSLGKNEWLNGNGFVCKEGSNVRLMERVLVILSNSAMVIAMGSLRRRRRGAHTHEIIARSAIQRR